MGHGWWPWGIVRGGDVGSKGSGRGWGLGGEDMGGGVGWDVGGGHGECGCWGQVWGGDMGGGVGWDKGGGAGGVAAIQCTASLDNQLLGSWVL